MSKPLLPIGCYDLLPPIPRQQSSLTTALLQLFESYGYEQVTPSLIEYSENLLAGREDLSPQIYRVMDGSSHKVMGIRPDITLQIGRLVASRLAERPRPLRVCYNELILRKQPGQLEQSRQLRQTGIELVGNDSPDADAEVILVAIDALRKAGISKLSIDLNLPGIASACLVGEKLTDEEKAALMAAISHKDVSSISSMKLKCRNTLVALIKSAGDAETALSAIDKLKLPSSARASLGHLKKVVELLQAHNTPGCNITVDATEMRGLNYHDGISFSVFVPGVVREVGRGGRYIIKAPDEKESISATGFTLYVETLSAILPPPALQKRIWVEGAGPKETGNLRARGFVTVHALPGKSGGEVEARRHGCSQIWKNGKVKDI